MNKTTQTEQGIAEAVAKRAKISVEDAQSAIDALVKVIHTGAKRKGDFSKPAGIALPGIGKFWVTEEREKERTIEFPNLDFLDRFKTMTIPLKPKPSSTSFRARYLPKRSTRRRENGDEGALAFA